MEGRRITRGSSALLPGSGFDVEALLAPQQALSLYFAQAKLRAPAMEYISLDLALGRILAQTVVSDAEYPAAPRSAMDGFAVRSSETPGRLQIAGQVVMGQLWSGRLPTRAAVRIPTGGVVPADADAVVPFEDVREDNDTIEVPKAVPAGDALTPAGSDMRVGEEVLPAGRRIGGAELGVLATLGITNVPVYRRPVAVVISSGDELVDISATPNPAQVRDSNRWAIAGTLQALGAMVRQLPTVPDIAARLEGLLHEAVATADAVFLTGGSSVGVHDLTPRAIAGLGEPGVIVHGLRVKPGKPTVLASIDGKPVIGLPGNPTSALMILQAVAAPIVSRLAGTAHEPRIVEAHLGSAYGKKPGWTWFVPVQIEETGQDSIAHPLKMRSSMVSLLARASGFATLDESIETLSAGHPVRVTRFI